MKHFVGSVFLFIASSASVYAQVPPLFLGTFEVFKTSGTCQEGEAVGTIGNLRYQQLASGTGLTFAGPSEVRTYFLPGATFETGFQTVDSLYLRFDFTPIGHPVEVRFISQRPVTITAKTPTIRVVGEVKGFTTADCVSRFRATMARWLKL